MGEEGQMAQSDVKSILFPVSESLQRGHAPISEECNQAIYTHLRAQYLELNIWLDSREHSFNGSSEELLCLQLFLLDKIIVVSNGKLLCRIGIE